MSDAVEVQHLSLSYNRTESSEHNDPYLTKLDYLIPKIIKFSLSSYL